MPRDPKLPRPLIGVPATVVAWLFAEEELPQVANGFARALVLVQALPEGLAQSFPRRQPGGLVLKFLMGCCEVITERGQRFDQFANEFEFLVT